MMMNGVRLFYGLCVVASVAVSENSLSETCNGRLDPSVCIDLKDKCGETVFDRDVSEECPVMCNNCIISAATITSTDHRVVISGKDIEFKTPTKSVTVSDLVTLKTFNTVATPLNTAIAAGVTARGNLANDIAGVATDVEGLDTDMESLQADLLANWEDQKGLKSTLISRFNDVNSTQFQLKQIVKNLTGTLKDVKKNSDLLVGLNTPVQFTSKPYINGTEDETAVVTCENVGNGVPKMEYKVSFYLDGKLNTKVAKFDRVLCAAKTCGVHFTFTDAAKKGKISVQIVAKNPIGSSSARSSDYDIAKHREAFSSDGCTCSDVKDKPNGFYKFRCKDLKYKGEVLEYETFCLNDAKTIRGADNPGWTLVARIDSRSQAHAGRDPVGWPKTKPDRSKSCGTGLRTKQGTRANTPPDLCGAPWKLPDEIINSLASLKGRKNSEYRLDCAARTGFYQFEQNKKGQQTKEGFNAYHEGNRFRYRQAHHHGWSRYIAGANSYGYHYSGLDDDAFEEGIGWQGYAWDPNDNSDTRYGPKKGCVGPPSWGGRPIRTQRDGFLWLNIF